jgi:hypothetical protein
MSAAQMTEHRPIRFRLRTLFCFVAIGAVLSEIVRWASSGGESPFFIGLLVFSYGGLVAILCYVITAVGFVLASRSAISPRFATRVASIVCALVWLAFVILPTFQWPPVCALYAAAVVTLMALSIRSSWKVEEGSSPERTLKRLLKTKAELSKALDSDNSERGGHD